MAHGRIRPNVYDKRIWIDDDFTNLSNSDSDVDSKSFRYLLDNNFLLDNIVLNQPAATSFKYTTGTPCRGFCLGHYFDIDDDIYCENIITFPNTLGTTYYFEMSITEVPHDVRYNIKTFNIEFLNYETVVGNSGTPDLVTVVGANLEMRVDTIVGGTTNHSTQWVTVWLEDPASSNITTAVQTCQVTYVGGHNIITTTGLFGQSVASVIPGDYTVVIRGFEWNNTGFHQTTHVPIATCIGANPAVPTMQYFSPFSLFDTFGLIEDSILTGCEASIVGNIITITSGVLIRNGQPIYIPAQSIDMGGAFARYIVIENTATTLTAVANLNASGYGTDTQVICYADSTGASYIIDARKFIKLRNQINVTVGDILGVNQSYCNFSTIQGAIWYNILRGEIGLDNIDILLMKIIVTSKTININYDNIRIYGFSSDDVGVQINTADTLFLLSANNILLKSFRCRKLDIGYMFKTSGNRENLYLDDLRTDITDSCQYWFELTSQIEDLKINNCKIAGSISGIIDSVAAASSRFVISHNEIKDTGSGYGINLGNIILANSGSEVSFNEINGYAKGTKYGIGINIINNTVVNNSSEEAIDANTDCIIKGNKIYNGAGVIDGILTGDNCIIEGNHINESDNGIVPGNYCVVNGNFINGADSYGIYLNSSFYGVINNNVVKNSGTYNFFLDSSCYNVINSNNIRDGATNDIRLHDSHYNTINNSVIDNGNSVTNIYLDVSNENNVNCNNIETNNQINIVLVDSDNNTINGNKCRRNTAGGTTEISGDATSDYNTVIGNSLNANGGAVRVNFALGSVGNDIAHNT